MYINGCLLEIMNFYRLEKPILKILYGAITVFTPSAITSLKVNRFGWHLE